MRQRGVEWIVVCALVGFVGVVTRPLRVVGAETDQLPTPWIGADIGSPALAGSTVFDGASFTISGGGADIWGVSDQFHFVYQQMSGDVDILASVDSFSAADPWSKIGVMIRSDLGTSAAHAFALVSGAEGLAFERRPHPGATSRSTAGELLTAPRWVRLVRIGTTVTGYSSADGASWQTMGSATIALGDSVYVGVAITSHNPSSTAQAQVSQVTVLPLSLPTGQETADIGSPAIPGSTTYQQGVYTITASGIDIWNASDQFRFVFQPISGDVDISARVDSMQGGSPWAKAGVMIRESLDPAARNTMALVTGDGVRLQWRLDPGGLTDYLPGGAGAAPIGVRLVRTGSNIEAFQSTDGSSWTSMGSQVVPMADRVFVGLAVTSQSDVATTTVVTDRLAISQSGGNQPPTVSLTAPTPGSQYTEPADIVVSADASDPQNQLARVEFYANAARIGSLTAAPFAITWPAVPAGAYSFTAVAYDAAGLSTTSSPVTITVLPVNPPTRFAIFDASPDDATLVDRYRLDVFSVDADPNTATPLASDDLGKPAPDSSGVITADCSAFLALLPPGTYLATVSAVNGSGEGRSAAVAFDR